MPFLTPVASSHQVTTCTENNEMKRRNGASISFSFFLTPQSAQSRALVGFGRVEKWSKDGGSGWTTLGMYRTPLTDYALKKR